MPLLWCIMEYGINVCKSAVIWRIFSRCNMCRNFFTVIYGTCLFRNGSYRNTDKHDWHWDFLIGITIVSFIILRLLAFINRKRTEIHQMFRREKETSQSKTEWTKIYNAQNIVEDRTTCRNVKANMGHLDLEYMVWICSKTDDAEKAVQLIKEINNQE